MSIALDAMGSDAYPLPEIEAAKIFAGKTGKKIFLVGNKDILFKSCSESDFSGLPIEIVQADDVLEMGAHAVEETRSKPNNSMAIGLQLVRDGKADAFVTMGNTGAAMFNSLRTLGRIKNVSRPALTTYFPVKSGYCIVLDIGANADCRPEFLQQFAIMGTIYAQKMRKIENPRVGLLNNGEEGGKGNELARETYKVLENTKINFIGNVEAKDVFAGKADVVVTDGFTGNVFLKASEASAKFLTDILKENIKSSLKNKIGYLLAKSAFKEIKVKMDPRMVGAAPLLGIDGLSFVGHGRSDATAVVSGLELAQNAIDVNLVQQLRNVIQSSLSDDQKK